MIVPEQLRVASPDILWARDDAQRTSKAASGSASQANQSTRAGVIDAESERIAYGHRRRSRSSLEGRASISSAMDSPEGSFALPSQATSASAVNVTKARRRSQASSQASFEGSGAPLTVPRGNPSARYVTVSSILSRSGAAMTIAEHNLPFVAGAGFASTHRRKSIDGKLAQGGQAIDDVPYKRASNGSALEALGALFLHRDSSGRVSNLSFTRYQTDAKGQKRARAKTPGKAMLDSISRGISGGATRLGIRMPKEGDAGETIAQRRARRVVMHEQSEKEGLPRIERTRRGEPSYEISIVNPIYPDMTPTHAPSRSPPPAPTLQARPGDGLTPPPIGEEGEEADEEGKEEEEPVMHRPRTFLRAPLTDPSGIYGAGSAFSWIEPPELPPSPVGMPGAWLLGGSGGWRGDRLEEGALLLPPPLLDDYGSDAQSFEGLLGIRRMREQEKARKQLDKLKARNRPAHKVGMLTAFSNFVRAAHAADRATRAANLSKGRAPLRRHHSEPADKASDAVDDNPDVPSEAKRQSQEQIVRPPSSQGNASVDGHGRHLHTVFESKSPRRQYTSAAHKSAEDDDEEDDAISDLDEVGSNRRTSIDSLRNIRTRRVPVRMPSKDASLEDAMDDFSLDGPSTPRIVPTLLSLPPSPWTPYGGTKSGTQTPFHLHLGMTPVLGALPGTPRLVPAMLEVLPSPFPTAAGMTPYMRSPRARAATAVAASSSTSSVVAPSPLALSPHESPQLRSVVPDGLAVAQAPGIRRRKTTGFLTVDDGQDRLTPSSSMAMLLDQQSTPTKARQNSQGCLQTQQDKQTPYTTKRSFLLWFLFGDLGLGSRAKIAAKAAGDLPSSSSTSLSSVFVALAAHSYGFMVFTLAHLVDLGYRIGEFLAMVFWFLRWMTLNLTGQTLLARCVIDAYALVAREWETVSKEDHERKGMKASKDNKDVYRGLSKWQVLKGLIELMCLQDVTRDRYLREGAGLKEIGSGWTRHGSVVEDHETTSERRIDLGAMRAADRESHSAAEKEAEQEEGSESETDSSDDDMVVTRRGPEILEFTKTPKVERQHGYFSSSFSEEDSLPSTRRDSTRRRKSDQKPTSTLTKKERRGRQMIKMIKWASRLSISAYGLHVTLVDLPATFTPSGDRFSRQTFAHLSRLHHEDVLHADIQTLDSADYSPTFYLVRDLTRKVVAVSVRGTQSLQDIIVDLEMVVGQVKLHVEEGDEDEPLYCHAGVLRAAQSLIARGSTLFRTLNEALKENPDFGIVFTGHSLGGAIASTVVLLLSKFERLEGDPTQDDERSTFTPGRWITHDKSGLPAGRSIRAITFAHPATFSAALASRAAQGTVPLVLSVVLGHDIIPRCGHGQARELRRVLGALSRVRRRREIRSSSSNSTGRRNSSGIEGDNHETVDADADEEGEEEDARVHVFTSWRAWRSVKSKGEEATKEERKKASRIEDELWRLRCDVENDLYANIKRRTEELKAAVAATSSATARENGGEDGDDGNDVDAAGLSTRPSAPPKLPPSPWIEPWQRAKAPLHQLAARRQALDAVTLANEEQASQAGVLVPGGRSIWLYEEKLYQITSPLSFFSLPDFHSKMFSEHFPSAYEDALERL